MQMLRRITEPVSENHTALVLALSLVCLAGLLVGLLWQSSIIMHQRDLIRALWGSGKFSN
jgi:hypothetical protein